MWQSEVSGATGMEGPKKGLPRWAWETDWPGVSRLQSCVIREKGRGVGISS
jgi:hypothetical protein